MTDLPVLRARTHTTPATVDDQKSALGFDIEMAQALAKSDIVPKDYRGKPSNVLVAIGLGRSLGLEPAASLYGMHVIEGKPSPSAKVQAALVRRAGHKLRIIESTDEVSTVEIVRSDDPDYPVRVSFTIDQARRAGWLDIWAERWVKTDGGRSYRDVWVYPEPLGLGATVEALADAGAPDWAQRVAPKRKDNWWTQPETMLHHRAVTTAIGRACPEVVSGLDFEVQPEQREHVDADDPVEVVPEPAPAPPEEPVIEAEVIPDPEPPAAEPGPLAKAVEYQQEMDAQGESEPGVPWTVDTYKAALKSAGHTQAAAVRQAATHDPGISSIAALLSAGELAGVVLDELTAS
ncbi:MAG: hypothetical protein AAGA99_21220 [Actinomycetota bacterium]